MSRCSPSLEALHARFLALLPRIELHARISFRDVRCPHHREDCVAEVIALAWKSFLRLVSRGKDPAQFPSALARFAALAVRSGRRLAGVERPQDVLSPVARQRGGFTVSSLPSTSLNGNVFEEALRDNAISPVPEQAAFRLDWPAWLTTRSERDRRMVYELMFGERTFAVAHRFSLSPGRVSQLRREFRADWRRFRDDAADL